VLTGALSSRPPGRWVVVAPDLGAVTLVERFAAPFGLRVVVVRKSRITGAGVRAEEVVGDVEGCQLVTVDDMIATAPPSRPPRASSWLGAPSLMLSSRPRTGCSSTPLPAASLASTWRASS